MKFFEFYLVITIRASLYMNKIKKRQKNLQQKKNFLIKTKKLVLGTNKAKVKL